MNRTGLILLAALLGCRAVPAAGQERVKIFGYFTFELEGSDRDEAGRRWTFDQHHFNIITIFDLGDGWRAFGEVEWTHGGLPMGAGTSGRMALERGWLEFRHSDWLQLRVGKYLAPFGIYNLRHDASPTYVMAFLPESIYGEHANTTGGSQALFSKFGTGVQALGRLSSDGWWAEYRVYVSNGRGVDAAAVDDNRDKGVGGRVIVGSSDQRLRFGASVYRDRNGSASDTRQIALGVDAYFEHAGFVLESELLVPRFERVDASGDPRGVFRTGRGLYVQGSRRIGERFTPFLRYEAYDEDTGVDADGESSIVAGLNFSLTPRVYLKGETHFRSFEDSALASYRLFVLSLAAAF